MPQQELPTPFEIGDLVLIKSQSQESLEKKYAAPLMCIFSVEVENKKKKTHDNITGKQIAERTKYKVVWFHSKKMEFVEKIIYHSFLKKVEPEKVKEEFVYEYGSECSFKPLLFLNKKKKDKFEKEQRDSDFLKVITLFPSFIMSSISKAEKEKEFNDFGKESKVFPSQLIRIMWFNGFQQKYSEFDMPIECLIKI
jgi:hypothetical protein